MCAGIGAYEPSCRLGGGCMGICWPYGRWFGFMALFIVAASASHYTTLSVYIFGEC